VIGKLFAFQALAGQLVVEAFRRVFNDRWNIRR
jgi:hypothetical protein